MQYTLEPIKVYFEFEAWKLLHAAITASALECSLIGVVTKKEDHFVVEKLYIPKQTRLSAYTKIVDEGIFELLEDPSIQSEKLKIWIHSHVNMGVSPSATDISQAKELMQDAEWFICGIWNKRAEYSLYLKFMGRDLPCVAIPRWTDQVLLDEVTEVLTQQTVTSPPITYQYGQGNFPRHGAYDQDDPYSTYRNYHSPTFGKAGLEDNYNGYRLPFNSPMQRALEKKAEKNKKKEASKKPKLPEEIGREKCIFQVDKLQKISLSASKISGKEFFSQSEYLCASDYLMYLAAPFAETFEEFFLGRGRFIVTNDPAYMINAVEEYAEYLQDELRTCLSDVEFLEILTEDAIATVFTLEDVKEQQTAILDGEGIPQKRGLT